MFVVMRRVIESTNTLVGYSVLVYDISATNHDSLLIKIPLKLSDLTDFNLTSTQLFVLPS
jgi:hypothetical protein